MTQDLKDISGRVLKNGKPLSPDLYTWDYKTRTFSSAENNLVLDFTTWSDCTFKTGSGCTFKTGGSCTFTTGSDCTFTTGSDCTFNTWSNCTFITWSNCTFKTGGSCTFKAESGCTFKTGGSCTFKTWSDCTFNTGSNCTFNTWSGCTFKTGSDCTFKTRGDCTFTTGSDCTFKTWSDCTFTTGSDCTFNTWSGCTFKTGSNCVILRRDVHDVIQSESGKVIQLFPYEKIGYLSDGLYNGKPHIIADGIVSEIISKKGNVYKVRNLGENAVTYLVHKDGFYSHGKTLKEARDGLVFKITKKDTSEYRALTLASELSEADCITMYRSITGACAYGVKIFLKAAANRKKSYTVAEIIERTEGQFGHHTFKRFFQKETDQ